MGKVMQLASFSMAEVTYATGDISYLVQEQAKLATFRVKANQENVSGVVLPTFSVDRVAGSGAWVLDTDNDYHTHLGHSRFQFDRVRAWRTANTTGERGRS